MTPDTATAPPRVYGRSDRIFRLSPRAIWRYLLTQPASFWLVCTYLFWEYVRPQSIYPWLNIMPWALWTVILCGVAFVFEGAKTKFEGLPDGLMLTFTAVVLASSMAAVYPDVSYDGLRLYLSWVLVYLLITNIVDRDRRFFVFILSYLLYNLKMSLHGTRTWVSGGFAFRSWGATGAPGWFQNSGEFGIEMSIFLPIAVAFILGTRQYWGKNLFWASLILPVTALISAVASSSRGALLGMAGVALWFVLKSKHRLRVMLLVAVVGGAMWGITPTEQKERLDAMGTDSTSVSRLRYWTDGLEMAGERPVLGIGYDNWLPYYRNFYDPGGLLPHNMFVEALAELGYTGLLAFLALVVATFVVNHRTRKRLKRLLEIEHPRARFMFFMAHGLDGGLVGLSVSGFFVTVLYYPFFWINFALTVSLHRAAKRLVRRHRRLERRLAAEQQAPDMGLQHRRVASGWR